jgi:hypothetical protein
MGAEAELDDWRDRDSGRAAVNGRHGVVLKGIGYDPERGFSLSIQGPGWIQHSFEDCLEKRTQT